MCLVGEDSREHEIFLGGTEYVVPSLLAAEIVALDMCERYRRRVLCSSGRIELGNCDDAYYLA